jgi:energy-coupling factor transporter ATP-binding protein EcfA2
LFNLCYSVSPLYIRNYRSIKEIDLALHKGKNVIVGRNNAGKSNIVRALDLVLGESSPDYGKSENITLNDFHTYNVTTEDGEKSTATEVEMFIWCELTREHGEDLAYHELYKCYGFYRCDDGRFQPPMRFGPMPENYPSAFSIDADEHQGKTYINPKRGSDRPLEKEFWNVHKFAIGLPAQRDGGRIKKTRLDRSARKQH